MMTKEQKLESRLDKWAHKYASNKFLQEKFLKTTCVDVAHFQSTNATKRSCYLCGEIGAVYQFRNKRKNPREIFAGFCSDCYTRICKITGLEYKLEFCP